MHVLEIHRFQYLEMEKIAFGAFAPLAGFMNEDEFHSTVDHMRLPSGAVFPIPVVLDVTADQAKAFRGAPRIALVFEGIEVGEICPESIFCYDREDVAKKVFGSSGIAHPGVANLYGMGSHFIGGPVKLTRRVELDISRWELTPKETKQEIKRRGWSTVAGFQTRNVPHRAHEYLQRIALELVDGLFIQPLVGWKRVGDYTPQAIITGYQALIDNFYPSSNVMLGILSTAMRYAGPREAVFHAIVRRNYGCTHFVVGRDHAGVGDYYGKYDAHELTQRFDGELGIKIMRLHGPFHCRRCDSIVTEQTCSHIETSPDVTRQISGTDMRAILLEGAKPDPNLMRPEIVASLKNIPLFVAEGDE